MSVSILKIDCFYYKKIIAGYNCVDPPKPPDENKLKVQWNPNYPPNNYNGTITYVCNAGGHNRFIDDYDKNNLTLKCLPENKFSTTTWPTCADGSKRHLPFPYFLTHFFLSFSYLLSKSKK